MKYVFVNTGPGSLQVDLIHPEPAYNRKNLHRPGAVVNLRIGKGRTEDILPYFNGDLFEAYKVVKNSPDYLHNVRRGFLKTYVCDDDNQRVDIESLVGKVSVEDYVEVVSEPEFKEDFTIVKGIGAKSRDALYGHGVYTLEDLLAADTLITKEVLHANAETALASARAILEERAADDEKHEDHNQEQEDWLENEVEN